MAGISVARLLSEPPDEADDVSAAALVVREEDCAAREAASAEVMEANSAESVMTTSPVEVMVVPTPLTVVSNSKAPVDVV